MTRRSALHAKWRRLITVVVASSLLAVPAAHATPPTLQPVTLSPAGDTFTASWTLPAGMNSSVIEAGVTDDTGADGGFLAHDRVLFVPLGPTAASYQSSASTPLTPGPYFIHVAAYDPVACPDLFGLECDKEFSEVQRIDVPDAFPEVTAGHDFRHVTADWSLPPGMSIDFFEVATSAEVHEAGEREGLFLDENVVEDLGGWRLWERPLRSRIPFPTGTYHAHVGAFDPLRCRGPAQPTCVTFISDPVEFKIDPNPPLLGAVGESNGHLTAGWTLPNGIVADFIEVSTSPAVYSEGQYEGWFLDEELVHFDPVYPTQTSYYSYDVLAPGTYYVHVAGHPATGCTNLDSIGCFIEFSPSLRVDIPDRSPKPAAPAAAGGAAADKSVAFKSLRAAARQSIRKLSVTASIPEAGRLTASGAVSVPSLAKVYRFRAVSRSVRAGARVQLRLKLPQKGLRAAKKALKRRKKLIARITITARDNAGNVNTRLLKVRLRP